MAYIKVDHSKFEHAATAIDNYIANHKRKMNSVDSSVLALGTEWKGADYEQLKKEWTEIHSSDSTSGKMIRSLKNYADALRSSAAKYKEVQARAVNRANTLCK